MEPLFFIGSILMLVVAHLICTVFASKNSDIGSFRKPDSKLALYIPLIFNFRLILFTILIFLYHVDSTVPFYFLLVLQMVYTTVFVFIARPYLRLFDIFRASWI